MTACQWCPHPVAWHSDYYDGWCAADLTVVDDGPVPYSISCWCGGTADTAGPRLVTSKGSTKLIPDGRYWRLP